LNPLSTVYATAARARRAWYAHHPASRRRLGRPVISVGNLVVGGSGKTPTVAALASLLRDAGERPVILSRGYGRRGPTDGVLMVSDGVRVLEPVERSGDEPQLLARMLEGVPVLVGADRHASGRVAEQRFDATVMLLDDGFQHFQLERDIDLLVVDERDLGEQPLPVGRLREPLDAAAAASALLVTGDSTARARLCQALGVAEAFLLATHYGAAQPVSGRGDAVSCPQCSRVMAVAGIARPNRFFDALHQQGWNVVREVAFRDHHWFTPREVARLERTASDAGAEWIVTTDKDAVRLPESLADSWLRLPMRLTVEPAASFAVWLLDRLAAVRELRNQQSFGRAR
jgi:tetraacyldisaccharide 4'-kinase